MINRLIKALRNREVEIAGLKEKLNHATRLASTLEEALTDEMQKNARLRKGMMLASKEISRQRIEINSIQKSFEKNKA
jgi:predicted  nucleic acid-binding Zn-ribbon protein